MRIAISQRFKPFSHEPGFACPLPGVPLAVRVYPTRIFLHDLTDWSLPIIGELQMSSLGHVEKFTGSLDLEKGILFVWGEAPSGYFRYAVRPSFNGKLLWQVERSPGADFTATGPVLAPEGEAPLPITPPMERLALGCHKAQDFQAIRRRSLLSEWLPCWHWLGQWLAPLLPLQSSWQQEASLFGSLSRAVVDQRASDISLSLRELYHASLMDFFIPDAERWRLLGSLLPSTEQETPAAFLHSGASLIRSLFVKETPDAFHMLPALPHELHAGRYLNAACSTKARVDFEWSKHLLRTVILRPLQDSSLSLSWQRQLSRCRLRTDLSTSKGISISNGDVIALQANKIYYLDRFEK